MRLERAVEETAADPRSLKDLSGASIRRIAGWLRPGGRFLASFGTAEGDWSGEWLGTAMVFSHNAPEATRRMVSDVGLVIERAEVLKQDNEDQSFLWITARKPQTLAAASACDQRPHRYRGAQRTKGRSAPGERRGLRRSEV